MCGRVRPCVVEIKSIVVGECPVESVSGHLNPRALGAATAEAPQPENHGALVFLDNLGSRGGGCRWYKPHLDTTPDGDGEGDEDKEVRGEGDDGGHAAVLLKGS